MILLLTPQLLPLFDALVFANNFMIALWIWTTHFLYAFIKFLGLNILIGVSCTSKLQDSAHSFWLWFSSCDLWFASIVGSTALIPLVTLLLFFMPFGLYLMNIWWWIWWMSNWMKTWLNMEMDSLQRNRQFQEWPNLHYKRKTKNAQIDSIFSISFSIPGPFIDFK